MKKRGRLQFRRIDRQVVFITLGAFLVLSLIGLVAWRPWHNEKATGLPVAITNRITAFTPYFYVDGDIPGDYTLAPKDVTYSANVLSVVLRSPQGKAVVMTQQTLPADLASKSYQNAEQVNGAAGTAFMVFDQNRTTGALFGEEQDGTRTLVFISTLDPIEGQTMKDLLRGLRPIR